MNFVDVWGESAWVYRRTLAPFHLGLYLEKKSDFDVDSQF